MPKKEEKKGLSTGAKVGIAIGALVFLFILFSCGLGLGAMVQEAEQEKEVITEIVEVEKEVETIVYKDDPETLKEKGVHIDMACDFAIGYVEMFDIMQEIASSYGFTDIHSSWYEREAIAKTYLDKFCVVY